MQAESGLFIGMDEAGYGPNLGPLLIAATRWKTPDDPDNCDFYQLLSRCVEACGSSKGKKLHLADSKAVNIGKNGFRSLETSALALLACLEIEFKTARELYQALHHEECLIVSAKETGEAPAPWYCEQVELPVAADLQQVTELSQQLNCCMKETGVELDEIQAEFVTEERFNTLVTTHGNKGQVLSRLAFGLLGRIWTMRSGPRVLIVGDKHGGRNRYDELLADVLDGEMIFRLEEGQQLSRYRTGTSELRFQVGGEAHLPVACASIIAKYLRELAMIQFNHFWKRHCPEVKATLGYPNDARRFREAVQLRQRELQIDDHYFWRTR